MKELIEKGNETEERLRRIGFTQTDYEVCLSALVSGNIDSLRSLLAVSQARIEGLETASESRLLGVKKAKDFYRDKVFELKFDFLTPVPEPQLTIVAGLPGSGKSTFIGSSSGYSNHLYPDLDSLRPILLGGRNPKSVGEMEITQEAGSEIATELLNEARRGRYNVLLESTLSEREWAIDVLNKFNKYKKEFIYVYTKPSRSMMRTVEDRDRPTPLAFFLSTLRGYKNFLELADLFPADIKIIENDGTENFQMRVVYSRVNGQVEIQDLERLGEIQNNFQRLEGIV
jgi:hypothetical protein